MSKLIHFNLKFFWILLIFNNLDDMAPDTFVSWKKFLHLNALLKYQKGDKDMFIDMWMVFIDPFHQGFVYPNEIKSIFGILTKLIF